jgi:hypothetical protein
MGWKISIPKTEKPFLKKARGKHRIVLEQIFGVV